MSSYLLGIHTSTPTLALGLLDLERWNDGAGTLAGTADGIRSQTWYLDRQMSSQLHPCLQDFFPPEHWNQVMGVAVAVGPGSFTSCRMGVTVARTLGQSRDIPVFGLSSLQAIAVASIQTSSDKALSDRPIAVQMDARREEWFGGIYVQDREMIGVKVSDRLWTNEDWQQATEGCAIVDSSEWASEPPVDALLMMAAEHYASGQRPNWDSVLPFYGRKPPIHQG